MISYLPAFDQLSSLSRLNLGLSSLSLWQHGRAAWMESDGAEHFPCCSARSRSTWRKVENLCSWLLFCSIVFWASFSSLLRLVVSSPPPCLSLNCFHPMGAVCEEPGNERRWLAATKQTATAAGRPMLPVGRMGACQHLGGSPWPPGAHQWPWGQGEPASFHCSVGCSLLQRDSTEELEAMTFQTLQMFAQGMWVSLWFPSSLLSPWLFSNLSILSFL